VQRHLHHTGQGAV
jgi:proteasome lid subunit RPN8/RPN11